MANEQVIVKETAGQFKLNWRDLALGAVVAAVSAVVAVISEVVQTQGFEYIEWKVVGQVAFGAIVGYLTKNFFTPQKTIVMAPKEEVKIADATTGAPLNVGDKVEKNG